MSCKISPYRNTCVEFTLCRDLSCRNDVLPNFLYILGRLSAATHEKLNFLQQSLEKKRKYRQEKMKALNKLIDASVKKKKYVLSYNKRYLFHMNVHFKSAVAIINDQKLCLVRKHHFYNYFCVTLLYTWRRN